MNNVKQTEIAEWFEEGCYAFLEETVVANVDSIDWTKVVGPDDLIALENESGEVQKISIEELLLANAGSIDWSFVDGN